ncbi:MAG: hypothetical protein OSJ36_08590 [Odoribacter sp.]|mgnify:CR=1 FL=1|nr:hypothetical protein [Odoribacter sp.]
MKRVFFLLCVLFPLWAGAQEKRVITETFDNNLFRWDEFYEKDCSAGIEDGYFVLKNQKNGTVCSVAEMPIFSERNFKLTFKFLVPKLNDKYYFGVVFNYEDNENYECFMLMEKKFQCVNVKEGVVRVNRRGPVILKGGKDRQVEVLVEKKGGKLVFSVDNMEAITMARNVKFTTFGFFVEGDNVLKVDEVMVEQMESE